MIEKDFKHGKMLFPIIFPDSLIHEEVAAVIKRVSPLNDQNVKVVSAGSIEGLDVEATTQRSATLDINSREEDAGIINAYPYAHGIL